ncbi:MAG: UDP-N-acetylglucosamine 1-carboxyvinyltransferase [Candidatus Eiseniibacteriota bacterium]
MDALLVDGGQTLDGIVRISGAKNAALPMMAAALLAPGVSTLHNVPALRDVRTMALVLRTIGVETTIERQTLTVDATACESLCAPYELVKTMRASVYVLGPLLARFGHAEVSLPGGCAWGPRPVDLHLRGMEALGAEVELEGGYIVARAERLRGAEFEFPISSVGATGNVLMAAVLAEGRTVLRNAAVEPEIDALAGFLNAMGARIEGVGTRTLRIDGVPDLRPATRTVIPDRIEAGTYLIAGAMARGRVRVDGAEPGHLTALLDALERMGIQVEIGPDWIEVTGGRRPNPVVVHTAPYPGLATDLQAQLMALAALGRGASLIRETIYPDRFKHVPELMRLGARIRVEDGEATIDGVERLEAAPVMASDLRASAALVLAGLVARGTTRVARVYHIDRGYERIEEKLAGLGARVRRVRD